MSLPMLLKLLRQREKKLFGCLSCINKATLFARVRERRKNKPIPASATFRPKSCVCLFVCVSWVFRAMCDIAANMNLPGPREPPDNNRPSLKMTARSYSCTTLKHTHSENGKVTMTSNHEISVRRNPHNPAPLVSPSSANKRK